MDVVEVVVGEEDEVDRGEGGEGGGGWAEAGGGEGGGDRAGGEDCDPDGGWRVSERLSVATKGTCLPGSVRIETPSSWTKQVDCPIQVKFSCSVTESESLAAEIAGARVGRDSPKPATSCLWSGTATWSQLISSPAPEPSSEDGVGLESGGREDDDDGSGLWPKRRSKFGVSQGGRVASMTACLSSPLGKPPSHQILPVNGVWINFQNIHSHAPAERAYGRRQLQSPPLVPRATAPIRPTTYPAPSTLLCSLRTSLR